jgi:hypothetical protein
MLRSVDRLFARRHLSEERLALIQRYARALDRPLAERFMQAVAAGSWQRSVEQVRSKHAWGPTG